MISRYWIAKSSARRNRAIDWKRNDSDKIQNESTLSCTSSIVCCLLKTRPFAHICAFSGIFETVSRWRRENNSMHRVARVTPSTYTHRPPNSMVAWITSDTWYILSILSFYVPRGFLPDSFESFSDSNRRRLKAVSELPTNPTEYLRSLKTDFRPCHTVGTAAYTCTKSKIFF